MKQLTDNDRDGASDKIVSWRLDCEKARENTNKQSL